MNYAVIGSGNVGQVLAAGLKKHGYSVTVGTRSPEKLAEWKSKTGIEVSTFDQAAKSADVLVLAVKGDAGLEALKLCGNIDGKIIIDATNPIAPLAPENGVLRFFTTLDDSLMERYQKAYPKARFVKAFSCVGNALMVDPQFKEGRPTMFICGNDESAKSEVKQLLDKFGWETEDMGKVEAARAIEPLCMLWCIPGFLQNRWTHALKMLR